MVLSAHRLTLRLILPCFPPDENEGTVEALALRRAVVADQLADPVGLLLPVHETAAAPTRAQVLASHVEGDAIGGPFLRPGIREPVEADRVAVVRTAVRQREGAERRLACR